VRRAAASRSASAVGTPGVPCSRGLAIDTCDLGHQAIAFAGSCPLCRLKANRGGGAPPLAEGAAIYASDLRRMLAAEFAR